MQLDYAGSKFKISIIFGSATVGAMVEGVA